MNHAENCHISHNYGNYGGGVFVILGAPTFNGNTIDENFGPYGSGLFIYRSGATVTGNNVLRNHASGDGGGISINGPSVTPLTLKDNTIADNTAYSYGGGVHVDFSSPTLEGNTLSGNRANRGGGVSVDSGGSSGGRFVENLITANNASKGGGLYSFTDADTFNRNRITGNTAEEEGGGVYVSSRAKFFNNLIANNQADGNGSGISLSGSGLSPRSNTFKCNTIARNRGSSGIYLGYSVSPNFVNTIIASHTTGIQVGYSNSTADLDATLWYDNVTNWSGSINHTNDYFDDPAFLEPNTGNYHIGLNSAAIDRGIAVDSYEDIDGDPRPQGLGYDIGADETGLVVTKQAHFPLPQPGALLTYTIHITNYSPITLTASITDMLPDHVTPGGIMAWSANITAPGGTWVQTVPVTVDLGYMGVLTNVVTATTQEGASAAYTVTSQVQGEPALAVTKQAKPDMVQAGTQLTYTIHVTNIGNVDLHAVITDTLPAHVVPSGVLTWTPIITAPGGVWTVPVVVTIETAYTQPLINVVQVTADEGAAGVYTHTITGIKPDLDIYLPAIMRTSP